MALKRIASAKLAELVSDTQLAFNAGKDKGVAIGDTVQLHKTVEIRDPDTDERLGSVNLPKLRLEVTLVSDKFCVARVSERVASLGTTTLGAISFGGPLKKVTLGSAWEKVDESSVQVAVGEEATISREESTQES